MELKPLVATCMQKLGIQQKVVTPKRIIKRSLKIAKQQAQDWGAKHKAEAPNLFVVFINKEDWDRYYCNSSSETAGRIANIVQIKLVELEYNLRDHCQVKFVLDHSLDEGVFFVEANFTASDKVEKTFTKQEINAGEKTAVLKRKPLYPSQLDTLILS